MVSKYNQILQDVKKFASDPQKYMSIIPYVMHKSLMKNIVDTGENFFEKDWDNLIILDACRFDSFKKHTPQKGELSSVISLGSWSWEFLDKNLSGRQYHDTVYISANPYTPRISSNTFHSVVPLYDRWDAEYQTIRPQRVADAVREIAPKYSDKRLVVHFMQPHTPFIGEFGRSLYAERGLKGMRYIHREDSRVSIGKDDSEGAFAYDIVKDTESNITQSDIQRAYNENLRIVLDEVSDLITELVGKTVITSDHGELLGETVLPFGEHLYGHPSTVYSEELRRVPWYIHPFERRKGIESSPPKNEVDIDEAEVKNRLKAWGYVE